MKRVPIFLIFCGLLWGEPDMVILPREQLEHKVNEQTDLAKLEIAPNKVPIVNIAQPNSAGVSHNYYEKFNVHREGIILNNSAITAKSQLGGMLIGNANLSRTGSASLIVNEVVGPVQSQINGFVEVHGKAADLVVANPNGISVNGGGFINAPKVTLTTGVPEFDANGALQSLLVQQGKVSIGKRGMHIQNCNYCDILANVIEINGAIQGQKSKHEGADMRVVSGYYRFDYPSRNAYEEGAGAPIMGVDSVALGGMYAGKIYFQAKGRDIGVKLPPNMVTNVGDLIVESDGSIHIAGNVNSNGKIGIKTSDEITLEKANIHAYNKIDISANAVNMSSTDIFTPKTLSLNAIDEVIVSNNKLRSVQALQIQGGALESIEDQWSSLSDMSLETTTGAMTLKRAVLNSPQKISIQSEGNVALSGKLAAKQGIHLISQGSLHQEGILEASEGTIITQASGISSVKGEWTTRDGIQIASDRSIAINNHSLLSSESPIVVKAGNLANLEGTIRSKEKISFEGNSGFIQGEIFGKNIAIEINENLRLKGKVYANEQLQVKSGSIQMQDGILSGNQGVQLEATIEDLVLNNTEITSPMDITLVSVQDVNVSGSLKTNETIYVEGQQDIQMSGLMQGRTAQLYAQRSVSTEPLSEVKVTEALLLEATNDVALQGQSQSGVLNISGDNIHIVGQHVSQGKIAITAQNAIRGEGEISSNDDISMQSRVAEIKGNISGKAVEILSQESLQITGEMYANEQLQVTSGKVELNEGKLRANQNLEISSTSEDLLLNHAEIESPADIALNSAKDIAFEDNLKTNETVHLESQQDVRVNGTIQSHTARLRAQRNVSVEPTSEIKVNEALALEATHDVVLQGQSQSGSLMLLGDNIYIVGQHISQDKTTITAQDKTKIEGTVASSTGGIEVNGIQTLEINGTLNSQNDITLQSHAIEQQGALFSRSGKLDIQARNVNLSGQILGKADITLQGTNNVKFDDGLQMASNGLIRIESKELQLAGKIYTDEALVVHADTLALKPQTELSGKKLSLNQTSEEAIQWNNITLQGEQQISVKTPGDINFFGSVLSSGEVMLESEKSMDFQGTESKIEGKTTLKAKNRLSLSGFLLALSSVFLTADEVNIQPQVQIESAADVLIDAQNPLAIPADSSVLAKDLAIKSPSLTNKGLLQGSDLVILNSDRQLTNDGHILSEGNLAISTPQLQNNGLIQGTSGVFNVTDLANTGGLWMAGPWTLEGDKVTNTGWLRIDGPWTGKFNTFENLEGWLKGTLVNFPDPMHWLNKARMSFSGDVFLPQSLFENVSADFYSSGDVVLDTLRNVNEKEPKLKMVKEPPYAVRWTSKGWNEEEGPNVTIFWNQKLPVSYCNDCDPYCGKGIMDWHRGYNHMPKVEETKVVFEQEPGILSSFRIVKNLFVKNRIDNFYSRLQVGENLSIDKILQNKGAQSFLKKQVSGWKYVCQDHKNRPWYAFRPFKNQPAPEILASASSTIQVGGKIQGTVQSFMNGEVIAQDENIKQGVALPAYAETAWDKEKTALKVLREGGRDPVEKLRFAVSEVDLKLEVPAVGGMAMAALPPIEVACVEEDERTQLWRLQVQEFLDEVRAEPLVFNAKYDAPYMIETNPMYVDLGLFYGSQYFLDRVELTSGGKPSIETRLGDAFFENQLIRKQIQAATNRFILSHQYANEAEQQVALYNNALTEAHELGLKPGERLTSEQVKQLKRDLIWLETEEVDGKQVLVPRVYLCEKTKNSLYTSASQILAKSIDLQVEGDVLNQGLIEAEDDLSVQAGGTIANIAGKIATQAGDVSLQAEGNVLNVSGEIASGNDLDISGKTIASTTTKQRMDGYKSHTDVLGATAKVSAKNALRLFADEHLAAIGTSFKGKDVTLASGGDMHLDVAEKTYHYRDGGGNWQVNEHGAHALQTTIEASNDVHLLAQDNLKTRAVKVQAGGDFEVKSEHGAVTSEAFKDYDYSYHYSHHSGGFFGGSSTIESTSYKAKDIGSDIVAQETGILSADKDVHLKAGKVVAKDLRLESKTGKVRLEAGKDEDFYRHYEQSSGFLTTSTNDEGHDRKVSKPVEIVAQNVFLPNPAEIDYKIGLGKEFREALSGRSDIDWKVVQDNYREWSEHTTTLSGPARMLVACVLSVITKGIGTSEWLAGHGIAEGTASNAALSAGIKTLAASAGTSLAANLGDFSKAFDELTSASALKNFASTMLTAGISQSVSTSLQLPDQPKTFTDTLKTNTAHGLVRTGVDSAISGGKVRKNFAQTMTLAAVDAGAAQVAHTIGDVKATGALNQVTHKAAHGALAVTSAKLTGRDPVGAAIGAVVGEIAAEMKVQSAGDRALEKTMQAACSADHKLSKAEFDALLKENLDTEMHRCVLTGQLAGASAAFLAGRDVASAQSAAQNATENNFALTTAVVVGTGAALVAANVYDYYQAYVEGGWNAVQAKWDEERALDISLATAGAGVGITIGPIGSAVGTAGGAIVGNATLRTKSIVQRLIKKTILKTEKKTTQLEFDFAKDVKLGQSGNVSETVVNTNKRWSKTTQFDGVVVHQLDEFIDPLRKTMVKENGKLVQKTNYELMVSGKAPIGPDGKAVELHHVLQSSDGPLVEITNQLHTKYKKQIHINPDNWGSVINRSDFNTFRGRYWKNRAKDFEEVMKHAK